MIRFRFYRKHWLLRATEDPRMPSNAKRLWPSLNAATGCLIAYENGKMVGFLRWSGKYSQGTWVAESHRRQGLALVMWAKMLERRRCRWFHLTTVTPAGARLGAALVASHPNVAWDLEAL